MTDQEKMFREIMHSVKLFIRKYRDIDNVMIDFGSGDLLSHCEVHLLEIVGKNSSINITEIAQKRYVTKGAVSQIANKLMNKGLVSKRKLEGNDKEIILELTEKGWIAFAGHEQFHHQMNEDFKEIIGDVSPEKLASFNDKLNQFSVLLDKYTEKYKR
ncbi:MAG: MarR family winged helix-turn-helix transcriptional regulator [Vampirovibrionia bacterium]